MNQYRMLFIQTSTPTPIMHQKVTKYRKYCMQNNQLSAKTLVELKYNSIRVWGRLPLLQYFSYEDIYIWAACGLVWLQPPKWIPKNHVCKRDWIVCSKYNNPFLLYSKHNREGDRPIWSFDE